MRKLTVTVAPNFMMRKMMGPIFRDIERIELKELMKVDFEKGKKIGVGDIIVKDGVKLQRQTVARKMEILDILGRSGNTYTCLVKVNVPKAGQKLLKFFDFDLLYDIPTVLNSERLMYSVIGEEKNLRKFLRMLKLLGTVEKTVFKQADYRGVGITQALTEKQNYILSQAKRWGYYEYPRKIGTDELARRVGVSRTTLVEHLRKTENKIMEKIMP